MHQENLALLIPAGVRNVCAGTSLVGKGAAPGGFPAQGRILEVIWSQRCCSSRNISQDITSLPEMDLPGSGGLQQWAEESWGGLTSKNSAQTNQIADLALDKEV